MTEAPCNERSLTEVTCDDCSMVTDSDYGTWYEFEEVFICTDCQVTNENYWGQVCGRK